MGVEPPSYDPPVTPPATQPVVEPVTQPVTQPVTRWATRRSGVGAARRRTTTTSLCRMRARRGSEGSTSPRTSRVVVAAAAVAAVLWRFPGAMWPLRPDEAGFLMVARAWDPQPDSLYGPYFVDRTPIIIGLVRVTDLVAGPYGLRLLGALGCAWLVVMVAAVGRRFGGERGGMWAAVMTAALVTTSAIDPVAVKGEILGIQVVVASFWCALTALEQQGRSAQVRAFGAGLLAVTAIGLKQNLAAGLVFGGVVLVGAFAQGRLDRRTAGRLAALATAGAAVPVLACIGWALASGVHLSELWFASFGFRGDANAILVAQSQTGPDRRAEELRQLTIVTGIALAIGWYLLNLRGAWRRDRVLTVATVAVLAFDLFGVYAGGSYWRPYLLQLVPGVGLAVATVISLPGWRNTGMRIVVVVSVLSALWSNIVWLTWQLQEESAPSPTYVGEAIAEAAEPGDTLVIFGGRADLQFASGLPSPYQHLWSLPMRTMDPDLEQLITLLEGPDAPIWFVDAVDLTAWDLPQHELLQQTVAARYDALGEVCGIPVHVRADVHRELPEVDCSQMWSRQHGVSFLFDRQRDAE